MTDNNNTFTEENAVNQNLDSSEVTENTEEIKNQETTSETSEEVVKLTKEEYEALLKEKKKAEDFEKATKKYKNKIKELSESKTETPEIDVNSLKEELMQQLREEQFLAKQGITSKDEIDEVKKAAAILGVSLEEAVNNDIVKSKIVSIKKDKITKSIENDIDVNSVFAESNLLDGKSFVEAYKAGKVERTPENNKRFLKEVGGLL